MIQMSAAANSATPTNSLTRRETVDPFNSNLHDDREHERPPARTFLEEAAQRDPQLLLDDPLVVSLLDAGLLDHVTENPGAVGQQRLAVLHDETARDDVGHPFERPALLVDGHHRHDQAVFGKMAP